MRKILCLLLTIILVGSTFCSFAEKSTENEFSVRGGIRFGMTKEEVMQIEKGKPFEPLPENYDYSQEEIFYFEEEDSLSYTGFKSIAGIESDFYEGGTIIYKFQNNLLNHIEYRFKVYSDTKIVESYVELRENLIKKYGDPYNSDVDHISNVCTKVTQEKLEIPDFYHLVQIDEWLAEYDGYYVVIDELVWSDGSTNNLVLCYNVITADEMNSLQAESAQQEEDKANEIDNDL